MKRFLLVDGSNLLFQMFFGMPSRIVNSEGRAIHGTLGFTGALLRMARMTSPTHIAVLFDGEHENDRKELLPDYKAGRRDFTDAADGDNPFSQLPDIYRVLDTLGSFHTEITDYEADDAIASCAMRFGVPPERYADYKALVGDASDNIPGVRGIGPKTAAALIGQYGTLDEIIKHAADIPRAAVSAAVAESSERLRLNYRLIHLTDRAALPFDSPPPCLFDPAAEKTHDVLRRAGVL